MGDTMLDWMNKLLGRTTKTQPELAGKVWLVRLGQFLAPLEKMSPPKSRPGLGQDMLTFVETGEPRSLLAEIGKFPGVGEHLHLIGRRIIGDESAPSSIYKGFDQVPADVGLRWALVLEAIVGTGPGRQFAMQLPGGIHWPEVLILHAADSSPRIWSSAIPTPCFLGFDDLHRLLAAASIEASALLTSAFCSPVTATFRPERRLQAVCKLDGYADAVERHLELLRQQLLTAMPIPQRLHMLAMLEKVHDTTLGKLAPELAEFAICNSKQIRAVADALIRRSGQDGIDALKMQAERAKPEQRVNAMRLLFTLACERKDSSLQACVRELATVDKAPSAYALLTEWDPQNMESIGVEATYDYQMPVSDWSNALTPEVSAALDVFWGELNDSVDRHNRQMRVWHESRVAQGSTHPLHQQPGFAESELRALKDFVGSNQQRPPDLARHRAFWQHAQKALPRLAVGVGVNLPALIRTLSFQGLLTRNEGHLSHYAISAFNALHSATGRPSLLELSVILQEAGIQPAVVFRSYCNKWGSPLAKNWSDEKVWPFFANQLDLLIRHLTQTTVKDYAFDRGGLFRAISTLPVPPAAVVNAIFDLALGSAKTERPAAQAALTHLSGKEQRIINALADGKAEVRSIAAQWLAQLRHKPAIPALEIAVAKEKRDVAKGAMLDALQSLGQPVEKYLDREALAKDATRALAKELPKDIEWFPWNALPVVRWADSKDTVSTEVIRWMLVQSFRQKSPEPNAVLRKYCAMFEPRDREILGQFVLETWMREDVKPFAQETALLQAKQRAQSQLQFMRQHPSYAQSSPYGGRTLEEVTAMILPGLLRLPAGSAINSKGLLAVAAACAGERAAPAVYRYIKEYYGTRAAQGKALIAMLAWIEHPTATQLMLSIGSRFRTRSFQEEATRQAEALAERKNWTLSELADRTIPSAGFDESGELELSYGERRFSAKLLPDFKVELYTAEGKKIASLPEPRQDEDAERVKDAKKAFSNTKKEIKSIVDQQTDRLYEALCTERDWSFEDWSLYLNRHAVVRRLLQRLVWVQVKEQKVVQVFRPLDDGTLTDAEDDEVTLGADARVRVAHDSLLSPDQIAQWQQHLIDYRIRPLFQQLGKGTYTLPEVKSKSDTIDDFEGYLIEAFALRGRALKLGYMRGPAEDGGWFHTYGKRFPSLGLEALIDFTGNPLPEQNRTVGLISLAFVSSHDPSGQRGRMPLSSVPRVLLSECYNDLRLIASEGPGFDSEWQKKTQY